MNNKGTVCIVDDDEAVRESLRILFFANGYQSHLFESADVFLDCSEPPEVDVFLLDLRMPGTDGMELHEIMIDAGMTTPVIFITGHGDIPLAVSAIQKGASGFLTKPFEEGELLEKVSSAVEQNRSQKAKHKRINELQTLLNELTPRETDVLSGIVKGRSNKQVAQDLNISPRTVEIHRARVMEKTGADSVARLVLMVSSVSEIVE